MGAGAAVVVMALCLPRRLWQGALLIEVVAALALLLWAGGRLPGAVVERLTDFTDLATALRDVRGVDIDNANYAEIERLAHWQAAVAMADDHPWLGVGFGNYEPAYPAYRLMNWSDALGHAHNYYLNLLAETGWIGLIAYLLLWLAAALMTLRALRRTAGFQRGVALGLLGACTHLAVHSLLDKLYVNNLFLHIGVMLGILAALYGWRYDRERAEAGVLLHKRS
ncbi:MAG: O-antigen ligase family protein [Anaerolineae bacterium]|nr:O-antigen ligase family protein [Anaerolineae bacterium]